LSETPEQEPDQPVPPKTEAEGTDDPGPLPYPRLAIGGVFMGLANLVPGVSGGTMVLALGLYEHFIGAVSDLTRLRFSARPIIVLAMLFGIGVVTIFSLSSTVQWLMETFLPGMLALFIGMTLGGVPLLYKEIRPFSPGSVVGAAEGVVVMALVAFVLRPEAVNVTWPLLFFGGVLGSAAMILPGISGSYLLLVFGLYVPIIAGVSEFKDALKTMDLSELINVGFQVILPVGLGVVAGIVTLSNVLKWLLARWHRLTVGFLLGLLVGSVLGLYPFKAPSVDKLVSHAIPIMAPDHPTGRTRATVAGGRLTVWLYGIDPSDDAHALVRELDELDQAHAHLAVSYEHKTATPAPTLDDVKAASGDRAVLLAYDVDVPKEVRRAAADNVPLIIVPNTEYSEAKAWTGLGLIIVGFSITFLLGRLGKESPRYSG